MLFTFRAVYPYTAITSINAHCHRSSLIHNEARIESQRRVRASSIRNHQDQEDVLEVANLRPTHVLVRSNDMDGGQLDKHAALLVRTTYISHAATRLLPSEPIWHQGTNKAGKRKVAAENTGNGEQLSL